MARDANRPDAAAALYLEAFRFGAERPDLRVQCGNMLKDLGKFAEAEEQYSRALTKLSADPDLALQMGHLHKLAGDPAAARLHYIRALELRPDWEEPTRELAALGQVTRALATTGHPSWIIPQLLPKMPAADAASGRDILRILLLGRPSGKEGYGAKVLRGIEATRGYWITAEPVAEIRWLLDGAVICAEPPVTYPHMIAGKPGYKHVFNLWHDFTAVAPGVHEILLIFADHAGRVLRRYGETLQVAPPLPEAVAAGSDAWVPPLDRPEPLADAINARPSVVRAAKRHVLPGRPDTILVQRADQLGDFVCSIPAIQRLRALFPDARLVGLVTPANEALAASLALFDEVLTVDFAEDPAEGRRILGAEGQNRLRQLLAPYAFDLAIDLGEGDDSRPLLLLSGARFLCGFRARQFPWLDAGLDFIAPDPVNGNDVIPPSSKFVLLVESIALMLQSPARAVPNADRTGLAALNIARGDRYAVIHAGARLFFSRWPYFDALVQMLIERTDLKIVLLSEDSGLAERSDLAGRLQVLGGHLPFGTLDALLSHCAIFVGNDSGPKHLAALRGAPVVSVHIPRNNWSEWGQEISGTIISRRVPCAGCGIAPDGQDCGRDFVCIRHVEPEEVCAAVMDLLGAAN